VQQQPERETENISISPRVYDVFVMGCQRKLKKQQKRRKVLAIDPLLDSFESISEDIKQIQTNHE
jgi:hypothetical protein